MRRQLGRVERMEAAGRQGAGLSQQRVGRVGPGCKLRPRYQRGGGGFEAGVVIVGNADEHQQRRVRQRAAVGVTQHVEGCGGGAQFSAAGTDIGQAQRQTPAQQGHGRLR